MPVTLLLGAAALAVVLLVLGGRAGLRLVREALVRSVPVQVSAVENRIRVEAWVLRREWVLRSPASGYLVPLARAGQHVPRSTILLEVVDRVERASLGQELEQVRASLASLDRDLEALSAQERAVRTDLEQQEVALASQIAFAVSFDRQEELQELLARRDQIRADFAGRQAALAERRAELEAERERLLEVRRRVEARLASATDVVRAPEAGRFELRVDGLEEVLTPQQVVELAPGYLRGLRIAERTLAPGDRVVAGQPVGRLVDPRQVHVYFFLEGGHGIGAGRRVFFQADGAERVPGVVREVRFIGGESSLLVELEEVPDLLLEQRRVRGSLILDRYEGVVVPNSALIQRDRALGVLVEAQGGRLFRQVQVKGTDGAWAAVAGLAEGSRVVVNPHLLGERPAQVAPAGER